MGYTPVRLGASWLDVARATGVGVVCTNGEGNVAIGAQHALTPQKNFSMASSSSARPPRQVADSLVDYLGAEIVAYYGSQQVVPPGAALDAIGKEGGEGEKAFARPPLA
jgi:hypothetical protein